MESNEMDKWLQQAQSTISETQQVDAHMKQLQDDLHTLAAMRLFEIFPFLADHMEPDEILLLGERIKRHLQQLSSELTNLAYTVQQRLEK